MADYPKCFETCQAIADSEGALGELLEQAQRRVKELEAERDELKAERDTWRQKYLDLRATGCYPTPVEESAGSHDTDVEMCPESDTLSSTKNVS